MRGMAAARLVPTIEEGQLDAQNGCLHFVEAAVQAEQVVMIALLRSVITHLITNALEASPDDELVTVRSQVAGDRLVIDVEVWLAGLTETLSRIQPRPPR